MSFHVFKPLISSSSVPLFSEYKFCSFVKFISKYFILFHVIVNGIVFLILFSVCSFLLCHNLGKKHLGERRL